MGLVFPAALPVKHCPVGCLPHQRANWATYAGTAPTELNMANEDIPVFPTGLPAVCFGQTLVTEAIFQPVLS